ncbi:MAG: amidohydrolase family protein, partial [Planctomycetia bacterium]|nr:amidohydrolase family protein [Planctomycetia bacterium]
FPGVLVIDGHTHIGAWLHAATFRDADEAAAESVAFMDANGVDAACSMGGGYMFSGTDYRLGNDFLIEVCRRIPDRLIGFAHLNPNDSPGAILAELDRAWEAGIRCIKLINGYQENYPGDGPNLMALYKYASEHGMLVFNHGWATDEMMKISAEFPDVDFIYGHYHAVCDTALKARANVYANIWNCTTSGWLDRGIENCGAGKFMFGSDAFLNCMTLGIGPVVHGPITDEERRQILGLTMARLLDKVGALPSKIKETYHI